jgi:hypothetical protein
MFMTTPVTHDYAERQLRHRHRSLTLAAMMISEFHEIFQLTTAVAVACSDVRHY